MGKSLLTPKQHKFLELASQDNWLTKHFYLVGGTALSEFYLHHRLSEDFDFFCSELFSNADVFLFLNRLKKPAEITAVEIDDRGTLQTFYLTFSNKERFKIDFSSFPFPPSTKFQYFNNLKISGIYDITLDKLQTICLHPRPRDYVDLYFILKEKKFELSKLIKDLQKRYEITIKTDSLANQLLKVKDININEIPKILLPFDKKQMEDYIINLSKSLENKILTD